MSTPTTATATLPPYNHHHFRYSHQHPPYTQANSSPYRPPNPILPSPASRLAYPSPATYSVSANHAVSNGVLAVPHEPARLPPQETANPSPRSDSAYTMPAGSQTQSVADSQQPARKRRRSRGPDWDTFYKNGLPKEIIVIEDTPEPERPNPATALSQTLANGRAHAANGNIVAHQAKRRKRDDEPTRYDPVHHNSIVGSYTHTSRQDGSPSKSTAPSDRTNSAIHTTAATSLGSLSSNGHYEYDAQPGQKRKRTTRQQIANEARRRDAGIVTDAFASYRPPPYPPKKARDVPITVIPDVSSRSPF
jgi:dual-specificity kinase